MIIAAMATAFLSAGWALFCGYGLITALLFYIGAGSGTLMVLALAIHVRTHLARIYHAWRGPAAKPVSAGRHS
ncbi:hypothetical protein ATO1_02225 [Phaeobacter sp. 22II1-1F12B]|nr:hypothetical protein ATO1_02225 [Phaeobacter sp. 22II1-1F12B]